MAGATRVQEGGLKIVWHVRLGPSSGCADSSCHPRCSPSVAAAVGWGLHQHPLHATAAAQAAAVTPSNAIYLLAPLLL